jgi:hypothetical protein
MIDKDVVLGDSDIRAVLRSRLFLKHPDEADTVVIEELGLCRGQVRVDVAVVNGLLHGYEIKSDRDSLRRLGVQVEVYGKVFDQATLVVGNRHLAEALDIVPTWWGVLHVHPTAEGLHVKTVRRARKNPGRDPRALVELLWLDDAIALLEERNGARGVRGKPRRIVWDRVCDHFGVDEIAASVRAKLKARATNQGPV